MGGGDLNLKKSWHTGLLSNQRKVWESEQRELAERKKIEQVRREREEERNLEDIARLAEANGGPQRRQRVEWMYNGGSAGQMGTTEEQESYLLGKRRVDNLLKRDDEIEVEKVAVVQVDPVRDITSKVALDPLLLIEKQRQDALEKAMAVEAKIQERQSRKHKKDRDRNLRRSEYRRDRRDRDDSRDRHEKRGHRERREHRHSHRSRSRGRGRSTSPDRRRIIRDDDDSNRRHKKYRNRSRCVSASVSPDRRRHDRHQDEYKESRTLSSDQTERRSSRSPYQRNRDNNRKWEARSGVPHRSDKEIEAEKAAKLAAMQEDASNLESDRLRRLAEIEKRDAEERERDARKRDKGGNFKASLYQQTEGMGLESRLKASRGLLST